MPSFSLHTTQQMSDDEKRDSDSKTEQATSKQKENSTHLGWLEHRPAPLSGELWVLLPQDAEHALCSQERSITNDK